eukprot:6189314-Pleurochrysis_carterae.AAC.3
MALVLDAIKMLLVRVLQAKHAAECLAAPQLWIVLRAAVPFSLYTYFKNAYRAPASTMVVTRQQGWPRCWRGARDDAYKEHNTADSRPDLAPWGVFSPRLVAKCACAANNFATRWALPLTDGLCKNVNLTSLDLSCALRCVPLNHIAAST